MFLLINRFSNKFKFFLERLLLRGAQYQLLLIACLIVMVSLLSGLAVYILTSSSDGYPQSAWWAFLRLSDPGYLGDDEGIVLRSISTVVTVLGYVLFMGALIAIMTQWLNRTLKKLESGLTSIVQSDHILVLGWTNRTPTIVRELILSEGRVKRFLRRVSASSLHIVILAEEVTTELANELQEKMGFRWNKRQVTFRSGTPLRLEHLKRVDFMRAAVILIPGTDFAAEGADVTDTQVIKTLLSISNYGSQVNEEGSPLVVAEILDARKGPIAKTAYKGDIEIIVSDSVLSRLIAQIIRHKGLSYIYSELLTHSEGNEIYIRECPQLEHLEFHNIMETFPNAIPMGVLRMQDDGYKPMLNPPHGLRIEKGDRLVIMARRYIDTEPPEGIHEEPVKRNSPKSFTKEPIIRKVLLLGWNHKIPALLDELDSYRNEGFEIDILSIIPIAEREEYVARYDIHLQHVKHRHLHGDYTVPSDLQRVNPAQYDNIVLLCNSWLESNEESDARSILGYLLLREMLPKGTAKPEILIELMDPENERLFQRRSGEVLISPLILGHIVAHVGLRRDLNVLFEELFTVDGAEIYFRSLDSYNVPGGHMRFRDLQDAAARYGDIALGIRVLKDEDPLKGGITMNPSRDTGWDLDGTDELVVLTTYS